MPRKRDDSGLPDKDWSSFPGFYLPLYTQTPDLLFDEIMPYLTGAELKCLLYIVRHTLGFKKHSDALSVEQFTKGVISRDGVRQDWGTGLARTTALDALRSLKERGLVEAIEQRSTEVGSRGSMPTIYSLRLDGGTEERTRGVHSSDTRATEERTRGVRKSVPTRNNDPRNNTRNISPLTPPQAGGQATISLKRTLERREQRAREKAEYERTKYTSGAYGLCPVCGSRPCIPGCAGLPVVETGSA
jgi:RNA polymerase-binding transcription factor DksA